MFEWSQVPLFLLDECPQLIQQTLGEMQMAKVIRHDLRTMRPETPQPLMHRVFIDLQDARRRSHAQPFCQELRSQGILRHIRANASIGCPSSGRYHISASHTAQAYFAAVTAMRLQRRCVAHLTALCTARVATMARHQIHLHASLRFVLSRKHDRRRGTESILACAALYGHY